MEYILVTGGCGYIGSHTIVDLLENNYNVISIDNLSNSDESVIDKINKITDKNIINYNIDIRDKDKLYKLFNTFNIKNIIHFAAYKSVPESVDKPLEYYDNNVNGLINLLSVIKDFDVKRFIFSSSCSIYGTPNTTPVNEITLISPESPYAKTKYFCEEIIKDFSKTSNTQFINLRYFNPIGAHKSLKIGEISTSINVLSRIVATNNGEQEELLVFGNDWPTPDGTCIRDYIHVSDVAEAHRVALSTKLSNKLYSINIGTGKGFSVLELISIFEKVSGEKLNYRIVDKRPGDVSEIWSDTNYCEKILNWKPSRSIEESIYSHLMYSKTLKKVDKYF
jgi:UDP-glucose 4-epimerase